MRMFPPVSKFGTRKEWEIACLRILLKDAAVLERLITGKELSNLVRRMAVAQKLAAGHTYREIGKELWISPQTISAINKSIRANGYLSYYSRHERKPRKNSIGKAPLRRHLGRPHKHKYGTLYY